MTWSQVGQKHWRKEAETGTTFEEIQEQNRTRGWNLFCIEEIYSFLLWNKKKKTRKKFFKKYKQTIKQMHQVWKMFNIFTRKKLPWKKKKKTNDSGV